MGKTITYEVDSTDTIDSLKLKIEETEHLAPHLQRIIFHGRQLDSGTIGSNGIVKESTLHMISHSRGCQCERCAPVKG